MKNKTQCVPYEILKFSRKISNKLGYSKSLLYKDHCQANGELIEIIDDNTFLTHYKNQISWQEVKVIYQYLNTVYTIFLQFNLSDTSLYIYLKNEKGIVQSVIEVDELPKIQKTNNFQLLQTYGLDWIYLPIENLFKK